MRHLARADQADALEDAADDQDPGKEVDDRHGGDQGIDEGENACDHHQNALKQVPQRITLDGIAHRFTHGRRRGLKRNGCHWSSLL